MPNLVLIFIPF